jgi:hypothetical protein
LFPLLLVVSPMQVGSSGSGYWYYMLSYSTRSGLADPVIWYAVTVREGGCRPCAPRTLAVFLLYKVEERKERQGKEC